MNSILKGKLFSNKKYWISLLVIIIVIGGGLVYFLSSRHTQTSAKATATSAGLQYSQATRGTLTLTSSGTGTLSSSQEVNLSFTSSGTVSKVNVQPGNRVKEGDVLAVIGDTETQETAVQTAELNLLTAKQDLETFTNAAAAALGNAQLTVATDQKAVDTAKDALKTKGEIRCDADTLKAYYDYYMKLKGQLDDLGQPPANGTDYYIKVFLPLQQQVATANAQYVYCNGYTDYEVNSSQANLTVAEATLKTDQATLEKLKQNNGLDPYQLAVYQNKVTLAENALASAKKNLAGATITAPFDGTIISVAGQAGDNAGSTTTTTSGSVTTTSGSTFIVMADLDHPYVDFYIDETDLGKAAVGDAAQVIFDALPNRTFTGKVTQLIPKLVTSGNSKAIQGAVRIESILSDENLTLPEGLNASVDIIGGEAKNAVLIPISALVDLGDSEYGVFVRDTAGKLKFRSVTVGLMDLTNAEIKSGLQAGEMVSIGSTGTK